MHGPATVGWLLVVLCAVTGLACLARTGNGSAAQRLTAGCEALMGFGMAVMALPATVVRPLPWPVYAVLFGAVAAWSLVLLGRARPTQPGMSRPRRLTSHHLHHTVGALAMVHLTLPWTGGSAAGGHTAHHDNAAASAPEGLPLLTALLLAYFAVYVVSAAVRLTSAPGAAVATIGPGGRAGAAAETESTGFGCSPGSGLLGQPEVTHACRLAMGMGTFAMLLTM